MTAGLPAISPQPQPPARIEAETDRQLVETWVARHESRHTQRKYRRQGERFLVVAGRPLREVRVSDVQAFLASLDGQASATRANAASAIKSLLSFAYDLGYAPFNAGKAVKAPSVKNTLAERIMPEADALLMNRMEPNARNRALLTLAYGGGLRILEVYSLRWRDLASRDGGPGRRPFTATAIRRESFSCRRTHGACSRRSAVERRPMISCSRRRKAGRSIPRPSTGL